VADMFMLALFWSTLPFLRVKMGFFP